MPQFGYQNLLHWSLSYFLQLATAVDDPGVEKVKVLWDLKIFYSPVMVNHDIEARQLKGKKKFPSHRVPPQKKL